MKADLILFLRLATVAAGLGLVFGWMARVEPVTICFTF